MDFEETMQYLKNQNQLSETSKQLYRGVYMQFMKWREAQGITTISEQVVLKYFKDLPQKYKPSTLWSYFSMLRNRLLEHNIDILKYETVKALLRKNSVGFKSKKLNTFTAEEINQFLEKAPDSKYLHAKVVLIVGVASGLNNRQLSMLTIDNIKDLGTYAQITFDGSNMATISSRNYTIYKKYAELRPMGMSSRRFFINYRDNSCSNQVIGINKLALLPCVIAEYLNLPNPKMYTGHCFRRASALTYIDLKGNFHHKSGFASTLMEKC